MAKLPSSTSMPQNMHPSPSHRPTHPATLKSLHRRGDDVDGDDEVWLPACPLPPGCSLFDLAACVDPLPECLLPPPQTTNPSFFPTTISISTATGVATLTLTRSEPGGAISDTSGGDPATATEPASSSGSPLVVPDSRGLIAGQLAGVIVGSVAGALLLLLLLWLLWRRAFRSSRQFGSGYGEGRKRGWTGTGREMRQKSKEGYIIGASEPPSSNGSTLSVPFLPSTKPPTYTLALSNSSPSLHKSPLPPSLSPPPWSTSSSAFDNAYAVSSTSAHMRSHTYSASASVSMSVSLSDNNSTLASESEAAYPRPPERHPNPGTRASAPPPAIHPTVYRPVLIPLPRRPPSTGETVSTSMVSFDQSDAEPYDLEPERDPSDAASSEARFGWEVGTAESARPLGLQSSRGTGDGGAGAGAG